MRPSAFRRCTSMPSSMRRQPTWACSTVGTTTLAASTRPASDSMSGNHFGGKFLGDFRGALGVRVHDADQFGAGEFAIYTGVIAPEIPRADDGHADFICLAEFRNSTLPLCRRQLRPPRWRPAEMLRWRCPRRRLPGSHARGQTEVCAPRPSPARKHGTGA